LVVLEDIPINNHIIRVLLMTPFIDMIVDIYQGGHSIAPKTISANAASASVTAKREKSQTPKFV